jgi:hypothetical protein
MARKKGRDSGGGLSGLRDGRLSYGTPITVGGRPVIPVTRVRDQRSGAARCVESTPVGFIDVSDEGSSFVPIDNGHGDGGSRSTALRATAAAAVTTIAGAVAGARALRSTRRSPRLLPAGRPRLPR